MTPGNYDIKDPSLAEDGFLPTMDAWRKALYPKTKAIVINWPNNPTGVLPSREYMGQLQEFAGQNNLWVISDEVYGALLFDDNQHVCAASIAGARERTLLINSLSKRQWNI